MERVLPGEVDNEDGDRQPEWRYQQAGEKQALGELQVGYGLRLIPAPVCGVKRAMELSETREGPHSVTIR